jgi:Protein of unknown function (DUF3987)/Primase C terminal 2 (PriCT-2)
MSVAHFSNASQNLSINKRAALSQLKALGYKKGDRVYMRAFLPSSDPRAAKDPGRKADKLSYSLVEQWQADGCGVYFVVNGGGHTNADVKLCRAIFYEHDNLDKAIQQRLWQTLGLPEPTIQVDTGGKSIHSYWVFDEPIATDLWKPLQTDLLEFADADRTIKNPSRVMRLAGAFHITPGKEPVQSTIVSQSNKRYSYQDLRAIVPTKQPSLISNQPPIISNQQQTQQFPQREHRGNPTDAEIAQSCADALAPWRCDNYQDWLETGMALHAMSPSFLPIWEDYSKRSSKYKPGECEKKWETFKPGGGITAGTLIEKAKQDGWVSPFQKFENKSTGRILETSQYKKQSSNNGGNGGDDGNSPILLSLRDRILEILLRDLSPSEQKEAFINLSTSSRKSLKELEDLGKIISKELEIEEDRGDTQQELKQLIDIRNQKLELQDYLHPDLAEPLTTLAFWMGVPSEVFLVPLLSISASLLSSRMRICANKATNFYQPFIFYMGLVCESGSKKSPIINVFLKALSQLQAEEDNRYAAAKAAYDKDFKKWKKSDSSNEDDPPTPPNLREFYVKNATHEALDGIRASQQSGFIYVLDELSGLIGSYGAYKGGRGTDKESILSGFDGNGVKINRAGGKRLSNPYDAMSITGATQPGKLRQQMGDMEDSQGEWARFLWVPYEEIIKRLPDDDEDAVDINEIISSIFSRLLAIASAIPEAVFTFEKPGKTLFNDYVYELDVQRKQESRQGMKAAIAKLKGYAARLTGIIYLLNCAAENKMPDTVIPTKFVELGIKLSRFFWGQVELIYAFSGVSNSQLAPKLAQIIDLARGQVDGRISNRFVCKKLKIKREDNLVNFRELETLGYGTVNYKRQGFDFILNPVSHSVSECPSSVPTVWDTGKPCNNNTFNHNIIPVSPVSPVSPPLETHDSNKYVERKISSDSEGIRDTGDTGDTGGETQQQQGFDQCPQNRDARDTGDTRDTGGETQQQQSFDQCPQKRDARDTGDAGDTGGETQQQQSFDQCPQKRDTRDTGDAGDTGGETQQQQSFDQCPQKRDARDTGDAGDTNKRPPQQNRKRIKLAPGDGVVLRKVSPGAK